MPNGRFQFRVEKIKKSIQMSCSLIPVDGPAMVFMELTKLSLDLTAKSWGLSVIHMS